jgi:hypothetical protein
MATKLDGAKAKLDNIGAKYQVLEDCVDVSVLFGQKECKSKRLFDEVIYELEEGEIVLIKNKRLFVVAVPQSWTKDRLMNECMNYGCISIVALDYYCETVTAESVPVCLKSEEKEDETEC